MHGAVPGKVPCISDTFEDACLPLWYAGLGPNGLASATHSDACFYECIINNYVYRNKAYMYIYITYGASNIQIEDRLGIRTSLDVQLFYHGN